MQAITVQVKVESAYARPDGNPSYAADWLGSNEPLHYSTQGADTAECYFAQSNYSSIFT